MHHFRVIQSLALTIEADAGLIAQFDAFRTKRNAAGYERVGTISQKEADEMADLAKRLAREVPAWLNANHPELA